MTFHEYDIMTNKISNLTQNNMQVATILEQKIADKLIAISKTDFNKFYRIGEMLYRRIARRQERIRLENDKIAKKLLDI